MNIIERATISRTRIKEVSINEIEISKFIFIDVRDNQDYVNGHLDGALSVPFDIFENEITNIIPDRLTAIAVYCTLGHKSAVATDMLQDLGYSDVCSIKGGLTSMR